MQSISIVHEILSREPSDQVPFDEIVSALIRMAEDSVVSSAKVAFSVTGQLGEVPADVATPLAVVLAELLQNAVEHAFIEFDDDDTDRPDHPGAGSSRQGSSQLVISPSTWWLTVRVLSVEVVDDGSGLPEGFDFDCTTSLGLCIVRAWSEPSSTGPSSCATGTRTTPGRPAPRC